MWCLIVALSTGAFFIAGAQALVTAQAAVTGVSPQDSGLFQLDGNTLPGTCATQPVTDNFGGDDWAALYNNKPSDPSGTPPCASKGFTFIADGVGSTDNTYWSAGGSKDAYDPALGPWLWKPNDVAPDKNDLVNAYAALYQQGTTGPKFLYFGSDRFDTSGDAQQGFQFLQSDVCLAGTQSGLTAGGTAACPGGTPSPPSATCTPAFTGSNVGYFVDPNTGCPAHHKNGDLLIIVNFNKGGTLGLAGVYEWFGADGAGAGCYGNGVTSVCDTPVLFGNGANCSGVTPPNDFCSIANTAPLGTEPVWPYTAKGAKGATSTYDTSAFIEGGVALSRIPGAGACFPTFMAETRSSAGPSSGLSLQAQLKDLAFGKFQLCKPGMTTQASENGTVTPGHAVHDTATVTITGVTNPPDPTGTVTFFLCGNTSQTTYPDCSTGGTNVGTGTLAGGTNTTDGIASAQSPDVNTGTGLANGSYCFRAEWPGDSNYAAAKFTDSTNECFRVLKIGTTTLTSPQPSTSVTFGASVSDHALITASANGGGDINGSVKFFICDPSQTTSSGTRCESPAGTPVPAAGTAVTVTPVSPATTPPTSTADSASVTANKLGKWCWRAEFTPTGGVYTGSTDDTTGECFTVSDTSAVSSNQTWRPQDSGSVSSANGAPISGTLTIQLYEGTGCVAGSEVAGQLYTTGPFTNATSPQTVTSNNTTYDVSVTKSVSWKVVFSSTNSNVSGNSHCENTSLTITN
jgi:hypothetical protein